MKPRTNQHLKSWFQRHTPMPRLTLAPAAGLLLALAVVGSSSGAAAQDETSEEEGMAPASASAERETYDLVVGENVTLSAANVRNYSEGVKGIVDVKLTTDKSQFVVVGRRQGSSTLLFIMRDGTQKVYEFQVFTRSPATVRKELEDLLSGIGSLKIRRLGMRFFIEGNVDTEDDMSRVGRIVALYPGQVSSLVGLGAPEAERQLNVRLDFFFVQYDRRTGLQVGLDWPGRYGGGAITSSYDLINGELVSANASIAAQPLPALDIASSNGWAKIMRQATVITANGRKASYDSGGEQNFAIANGLTSTIQSISFGTKVDVLPQYDTDTGDFQIDVTADVSELVASESPLPGRARSNLTTSVRLKLGQSLVLSGIRSSTERRSTRGLPLLSDIPILGALFGTQGFDVENVEGALFIVPSAVDAIPKPAATLVDDALKQFDEFDGDMDEVEPPHTAKPKDWLSSGQQPSSPPTSDAEGSSKGKKVSFKASAASD